MRKFTKKLLAIITVVMIMATMLSVPVSAASFEITTTAVEQPAYNASASYDLAAAAGETAITEGITWALDGEYADVTLTEAGKLTITRTEDNSNSETIKVNATYNGETVSKDITVTPVDAYYRSDKVTHSAGSYNRDTFVTNLSNAENIAVLNFENEADASGGNFNLSLDVSGVNDAKMPVTMTSTGSSLSHSKITTSDPALSGKRVLSTVIQTTTVTFDTSALGGLQPKAIGFAINPSYSEHKATVTYSDDTTDVLAGFNQTVDSDKYVFYGFKAPVGKYITSLEIKTGKWSKIDDICILLKDPTAASFEITTTEVEQPAYNASASYDLAASDGGVTITEGITWELDGTYTDATITAAGKLTIKRTEDNSNSGTIKVKATSGGETVSKDITVTPVDAYYRSDKVTHSVGSYNRDTFVTNLNNAKNIAVLNFEEGTYSASGDVLTLDVSGVDDAKLPVTMTMSPTSKYSGIQTVPDTALSGEKVYQIINNQTATFTFDTSALGGLQPIAIGYAIRRSAGTNLYDNIQTATYSDGSETVIKWIHTTEAAGEYVFYGFKAPEGKHIKSLAIKPASWSHIDDICIVLDTMPTLTTKNAEGTGYTELNAISALNTEVKFTSPVTNGTVILAFYGANDKLLAVKSASGGEVTLEIDPEETYTKIAGFVWDSITGLTPIGNCAIVEAIVEN